jgi:phospholipid/cholesterol/gamma-HCH transport system ATP-binding protein
MTEVHDKPVIRVRGLTNRFRSQVVHEGLDMEVQSNEIFGIVGGSGAGKSVLLRTILGLRRADAGIVDAYERAVNSALAEIVGRTSRSLTETLEHR